jgi:hypothetical protein
VVAMDPQRPRVRLVHWNGAELGERVERLRTAGFDAANDLPEPQAFLRHLRDERPAAVVIDLGRVPSHGRDLALAIRTQRATREIPLVFVGGDPSKVEGVRALLPDAAFTTWDDIGPALRAAIAAPPAAPIVPASSLVGYAGTPLLRKLGITQGTVLALLDPPAGFDATLGAMPDSVVVTGAIDAHTTLAIWFVRRRADLATGIGTLAAALGSAKVWIAWPKKTGALAADLGQRDVRDAGLGHGLVDFKVCAIDETWSGLLFTRRSPGRVSAAAAALARSSRD